MTQISRSTSTTDDMELIPYIYFYGRAEEALEFYKAALDGTYTIVQRNMANGDPSLVSSFVGKVSYAPFSAPGISFAVSDGGGPRTLEPGEGNITLSLRVPSTKKAETIFAALADGGTIVTPFGDVPWGGKFGSVRDRFQNEWFVLS